MTKPRALPPIEQLREMLIYDPETGILVWQQRPISHFSSAREWKRWNRQYAGRRFGYRRRGYIVGSINHKHYQAHRIAYKLMTSVDPPAQIDHRDFDRANNRWKNIRPATHAENTRHVRAHRDATLLKGINKNRLRWQARISLDRKRLYLGTFKTPQEAHAAYCQAAIRFHGEFSCQEINQMAPTEAVRHRPGRP
jgi:hypothetical protein